MQIINSRADLDAIAGTPEHAQFMRYLEASLWLLEAGQFVPNDTIIIRFGFARADFPNAKRPAPLHFAPPQPHTPAIAAWRGKTVLDRRGHTAAVEAIVNRSDTVVRRYYQDGAEWHRRSPAIASIQREMGWTDAQLNEMWAEAIALTPP